MKRLLIVTLFLSVYCLGHLEAKDSDGGEEIMEKYIHGHLLYTWVPVLA